MLRAERGIGSDEESGCLCEEGLGDHADHPIDADDGSLQLALFRTADAARHE